MRSEPMVHLKALREERGLSQLALGLEIDVSASSIQQYESGKNSPSLKVLTKLADFFEVSLDYMFDRTELRNIQNMENQLLVDRLSRVSNEIIREAIMDILGQIIVDR